MPPTDPDYARIQALYAKARAIKAKEDAAAAIKKEASRPPTAAEKRDAICAADFRRQWNWTTLFFAWLFLANAAGIYFFTKGFLLTRLVLEEHSTCEVPPRAYTPGSAGEGCWHPRSFEKAVVVIVDALRYDFAVPVNGTEEQPALACHNALPFLYETAVKEPHNAFLLPFIADPPTTTLQRLKGLTTGTLPTFIDAGSNFAGTAIEEDNLLAQLKVAGKRIAHLGDDTWTALFPGYFEENVSRAYDSFNVWDLHTVDNGVVEHALPLLKQKPAGAAGVGKEDWDVLIAHFLGVDHAGHRYGPDHPAMTAKLAQMDVVLRDIVAALDDDTLLVVMGDHGMDAKGDHGGESDDEVQAALWMYSRRGIFGRTAPETLLPPSSAKDARAVNQIDLVPTLALLLGLPIPFNNLGRPIEEAFAGRKGNDWANLASVAAMTAAGVERYQDAYFKARGIEEGNAGTRALWGGAQEALERSLGGEKGTYKRAYELLTAYQRETLDICRGLWARFDVTSMVQGLAILAASLVVLLLFARNAGTDSPVMSPELEQAELQLEKNGVDVPANTDADGMDSEPDDFTTSVVKGAFIGILAGASLGVTASSLSPEPSTINDTLLGATACSLLAALIAALGSPLPYRAPFPTTPWSFLALLLPALPAIGFGANSFTIWEDQILLYLLSTLGLIFLFASFSLPSPERTLGITQAVLFTVLTWLASLSKLCREEQMPFCRSTYYASATSSTSAPWQLALPYLTTLLLPSVLKSYLLPSRNYRGPAPLFLNTLRAGLFACAIFWTLDAADDGAWFPFLPTGLLKTARVAIAQVVLGIGFVAGPVAYAYSSPCVSITRAATQGPSSTAAPAAASSRMTVTVLGYANAQGSSFLLLFSSLLLPLLLLQKPMGAFALALGAWQILALAELVDVLKLRESPIAPVALALMGSFYYFKTGHQATLASLQWESAFVPLHAVVYPWSPLMVGLNTFGGPILAGLGVPLVVLWKREVRGGGVAGEVARGVAWWLLVVLGWGAVTAGGAGWLRRHLMLYRVFSPKWMMAGGTGLVVQVVVGVVVWLGVGRCVGGVGEVFGWV
ncbi:hypothetical protein VE00_01015 [Pseudogymnoascus sp. WSF 3629]|nr:hypothetical protein VE00_01015 [Pseudogymnoascus sp. WSF 3629]